MRKRISLEARVWAAIARTSFSSSIPFSRSTGSSGRRGDRARRLFGHRRSGTTDSDCRVLHLPSAPTSGALRFEAECQPIGGFPARQTHGSDVLGTAPECAPRFGGGGRTYHELRVLPTPDRAERHRRRPACRGRPRARFRRTTSSSKRFLPRRTRRYRPCSEIAGARNRRRRPRRRPLTASSPAVRPRLASLARRRQPGGHRPGRPTAHAGSRGRRRRGGRPPARRSSISNVSTPAPRPDPRRRAP